MTATQKTGPWISVSRAEHSQPVNSTSLAKHPQLLREQNWEMHHLFLFHPVHPVDPRFSYLQKSDERIQLFKKRRALGRTPKTPSKTGWSHLKIGMIQTETWDLPTSRDFFKGLSWTQMTKNFVQKVSLYDGFTLSHPIGKRWQASGRNLRMRVP